MDTKNRKPAFSVLSAKIGGRASRRTFEDAGPVVAAVLAAVSPGFQPGGMMWKPGRLVVWLGRQDDAAGYGRQGCPPLQVGGVPECARQLVGLRFGN